MDASLFRLTQQAEEGLDRGGSVGPGDRLFLEVLGLEEMHVYVLNEDERGDAYVLFPAGLDPRIPLPRAEQGRPIAYAPVSVQAFEKLRGIGGLAPVGAPPAGARSSRLAGIARSLAANAARDSGIWTWEIEMENPSISPR